MCVFITHFNTHTCRTFFNRNHGLLHLNQNPYNPKICCQLFDFFINPVLSYAREIWGFSKSKEIERIHLNFLKSILNVHLCMVN